MIRMISKAFGVAAFVLAAGMTPAAAQDAAAKPASPAVEREAHGDWGVGCMAQAAGQTAGKVCTFSQEQFEEQSRQRVIAIELQPEVSGAKGVLILPFGLDVQQDVSLQLDDAKPFATARVGSCVPVGCVVAVKIDAVTLTQLGKGKALKVTAMADGSKPVPFAISLKGFDEALKRTRTLAQSK